MPVFKSGVNQAPAWCELEYFDIVRIEPGQTHVFERRGAKEKLIVGAGRCRVTHDGSSEAAEAGANLDLHDENGRFEVTEVAESAVLIRMAGRWGDEVGGSGLFSVNANDGREDRGDKTDYRKETSFDCHYHDCDEYWIVFEGRGVAMSEGKLYEVAAGDNVATGAGHHHDFPIVHEPVRAVYFETTMEGRKRRGHLWTHTHGPAEPDPGRV